MDISTDSIKKLFVNTLHRFHVVIFVVLVLGGLAVMILTLNNIITKSSDISGQVSGTPTTFDQATIERIEELKTRDDPPAKLDLSKGRTNPFVE